MVEMGKSTLLCAVVILHPFLFIFNYIFLIFILNAYLYVYGFLT